MPYFLDGNNLIGSARRTSHPSQEDRAALVAEVADRLRVTKARAVLFFDGAGERDAELGPLSIRAARGSADRAILSEIADARAPGEIILVTADRELSSRARDLGARTLSPKEFWNRVGAAKTHSGKDGEPAVDVEAWMRYFENDQNRK